MKHTARLLAVVGAVGVAALLFRSGPRDVVLVYDLQGAGTVTALRVAILKGDEVVRRATFPGPGGQVRHPVRLTGGAYRIDYRLEGPSGAVEGTRDVTLSEAQSIVLRLGR